MERNIEYSNAVQENTEKLNLLAVLEEEKNRLTEILKAQESGHLEKDFSEREKEYENDLNRLIRVTKCQKLQLQVTFHSLHSPKSSEINGQVHYN